MATRVVTVNDVLDGHVSLDLECFDRVYLNGWVPTLQVPGHQSASKAAMVDLMCQHKNHTLLIEGPEITIRPVGTRRVTSGSR